MHRMNMHSQNRESPWNLTFDIITQCCQGNSLLASQSLLRVYFGMTEIAVSAPAQLWLQPPT